MNTTHLQSVLSLGFDPMQMFRACGMRLDPWQAELLTSTAPRVLLNCCRQAGKSTTVAALSLHTALYQPDSLVLLLSRSLRQSTELFRKVLDFYRATDKPVPAVAESGSRLELANGSRILSLPGREENIRGYSGVKLLVIDEAARVPNSLYRSVRPMLAVSGGRLICLSTPYGRRGFFYRSWVDEAAGWQRIEIPATQCPRISAEHLAEERRTYSKSWFNQEYACSFEALEGLVYPEFDQCLIDELPPEVAGYFPGQFRERAKYDPTPPPVRWYGGIDWGYNDAFAAVWGFRDRNDVLWIVNEVYGSQMLLPDIAEKLPKDVRWYAGPDQPGLIEWLRKADRAVNAANNAKLEGITLVAGRIQSCRLKVLAPACPNLVREMGLYHYSEDKGSGTRELTDHAHSHSPDALRYLISKLDDQGMQRLKRRQPSPDNQGPQSNPWMDWRNEELWTRLD